MEAFFSIFAIFALIFLNGTFVAAEFAVARIRKTRIDQIVESPDDFSKSEVSAAKILQKVLLNINDYISACQVGITISSLTLGAVAEAELENLIAPLVQSLNLNVAPHSVSIVITIGIVTFFHVILGEVIPKNLAIINAEKVSFSLVYFLQFLHLVFKLPIQILNGCSRLCLRIIGVDMNFTDDAHSEDELKMILSASQAQGVLEEEEEQLIQNVFEFNDTIARDIMVPRSDIFFISSALSIEEAGVEACKTSYARFPIFEGRVDNIIGYVTIKDILRSHQNGASKNNIKTILTDILKVSDGIYIIDLIKLLQEKRRQMAVLIDEFGGVSGLVTVEDIVEEIFGEIVDEGDKEEQKPIEKISDREFLVDGLVNIQDLNDEIGTDFISQRFDTLGGYVFGHIGTEPHAGDFIEVNGYKLTVVEHFKNRVRLVKVTLPASKTADITH